VKKYGIGSFSMWLIVSVMVLTFPFFTVPVSAGIRLVPQEYPTIQAAVDAARPKGDIIQVSAGIYYERVYIDKEVTLIGADKATTIIDGHPGDVIRLANDVVTITGFTIRNGDNGIRTFGTIGAINVTNNIIKNNRYGVTFLGDPQTPTANNIVVDNTFVNNSITSVYMSVGLSNTISQNNISGSAYGIDLMAANETTISGNLFSNNSHGINMVYSGHNDIINNTVIDNQFGVVTIYSEDVFISENIISGSTYAIQTIGVTNHTILHNNVSDNPGYGIYLADSDYNHVTNNTASRNTWGLLLNNSTWNDPIEGNTISDNTFGITTDSSANNTIFHNNFVNNVDQITRDIYSLNWWSQGGEGNHWSDYQGVDDGSGGRTAGDGIGDTLIPHLGEDNYPLMNTWPTPQRDVAILAIYESTNIALVGEIIDFEVIVKNEGYMIETFNVTLQNNVTVIEERTVTDLAPYTNTSLIFNWNTSTVSPGYYLISATADPVPTETDLADNTMTDGTIRITLDLFGDINGDGTVDVNDLILLAEAYGATSTSPNWNPDADLNDDGIIDVYDQQLLSQNYGATI
jgi:parallel beta-helix repeat protein